jgi:outer membrane protein assembly factor BamA
LIVRVRSVAPARLCLWAAALLLGPAIGRAQPVPEPTAPPAAPAPDPAAPPPDEVSASDPGEDGESPPASGDARADLDPTGSGETPDPGAPPEPPFGDDPPFEGTVIETGPPAAPDDDPDAAGEGDPSEAHVVRYYLERFEVTGNERTRAETVLRLLLLTPGETFRADDPRIEESKVALLASGFFEEVRFSLQRGTQHGWVVFRVHVRERWTLLIDNLAFGYTTITPFGGLGISELNLFGTGSQLSAQFVIGDEQQAYRLRFLDPAFLGSDWSLSAEVRVSDAQDYLGFTGVRSVRSDGTVEADHATINYWRAGGRFGTGVRLSDRMRVDLGYRFEWLNADLPVAASYQRGAPGATMNAPIPLDLLPGQSLVSGVGVSFSYDTRDDPFLPTEGMRLLAGIELAHNVLGSDYSFAKFTVDWAMHFELPWEHTLTVSVFAGAIVGSAPLFDQFYVGDLSDLIPGRVLDLNFHDYPSLNLLGTSIIEMQYEDLAAKVGVEYAWPLYRSRSGFLYGLDLFLGLGLFTLASATDIALQIPGYAGGSVFPVDLTGDVGLRFDTMIGLFRLSFSNIMGLIPQVD